MLQVQLSRSEGAPGQTIQVQVRCPDPSDVSQVRLVVDEVGANIDWGLQRQGDEWGMEASVPYDAPSGTYNLSFRAYGAGGRLVDSTQLPFTVL